MKTIAVANQKGGCGKTTTAINLSAALAAAGWKTLLIDLDPQAHASFGLATNIHSEAKSVYNILTNLSEKRHPLADCIVPVSCEFDIVPSDIRLSTLEQELKDQEDAVSALCRHLSSIKRTYAYVILDCPPSLGFLTFNALRAADQVIIPIDMSAFTLMGVGKLLGMLELLKKRTGHVPQVYALATLFDRRTKYSQAIIEEIRTFFGERMLQTVIRPNVALKQAVAGGVSILDFDKASHGAEDYTALSREILRIEKTKEGGKAITPLPSVQAPEVWEGMLSIPAVVAEPLEPGKKEVTFQIAAPAAKDVYLAGDFNGWVINSEGLLSSGENGRWEKRMALPSGRYRYKFFIDGEWILDSQNPEQEPNAFGTLDSILNI